jgi:hypothetical protein
VVFWHSAGQRRASHQQIEQSSSPDGDSQPDQPRSRPQMNLFAALGRFALLGLASPFLELQDGIQGLLGLFILSIGIRIAWKITAGIGSSGIIGPFSAAPPAST